VESVEAPVPTRNRTPDSLTTCYQDRGLAVSGRSSQSKSRLQRMNPVTVPDRYTECSVILWLWSSRRKLLLERAGGT